MKNWILYIIKCRDSSLYTGITTNLEQRIKCHNEGIASKYTSSRRPVELVYTELFDNESSVRKREAELKKLSHYNKLRIIRNNKIAPRRRSQTQAARDAILPEFNQSKIAGT